MLLRAVLLLAVYASLFFSVVGLSAATVEDAKGYMDAAVLLMQESNEDSSKSVDAAVLLVQARDIFQELEDWDNVREANACIFYCKKKMNVDDLDRYVARTQGDKEAAQKTLAVVDAVSQEAVAADKAGEYLKSAQDYAAAHSDAHFIIHIRYLEVAERFVDLNPAIASQAMRLSSDALTAYAETLKPTKPMPNTVFLRSHKKSVDLFGQERAASPPDDKTHAKILKKLKKDHKEKFKSKKLNQFANWLLRTAIESKMDRDLAYVLAHEAAEVAMDRKLLNISLMMRAADFIATTYAGPDTKTLQIQYLNLVSSAPLVKAAILLLDQADDEESNTLVGRSFCFTDDNFADGLVLLSAGVEGDWKRVAQMEELKPSNTNEMLELADLWFALAEDKDAKDYKVEIYGRSLDWYVKVIDDLGGLVKTRTAKRIEQLKSIVPIDLSKLDYNNLTVNQWELIPGKSLECKLANTRNQTKVKLREGESIRVVPHPKEEWGVSIAGGINYSATWEGMSLGGPMGGGGRGGRGGRGGAGGPGNVGQMEVYLDEDPNATPVPVGVIDGPGELFIGGSVPRNMGVRAIGSIAVKFVPVGEVW